MNLPANIEAYWAAFLESPAGAGSSYERLYETFRIGADEHDADQGAALILSGAKTATSSLLWEYEHSGKPLPTQGCMSVLQDGAGTPVCIVETTWIEVIAFCRVDAQFADDYGEGDRTLEGWRKTFWSYYTSACSEIGREMSDDTPLVCERFRVIYR